MDSAALEGADRMPVRELPILPTMGVGSYAAPGWFIAMQKLSRANELGTHDLDELVWDATRVVVSDQVEAGLDVISDGELSRQRFVYEMFGRLSGLERIPPSRKLGIAGYDTAPRFVAVGPIAAPSGLGAVAEFRRLAALAPNRVLKVALPGPLTFAGAIDPGARTRDAVLQELIALLSGEIAALAAAGAAYIQLDEPGLAAQNGEQALHGGAAVINAVLAAAKGRTAVHICFGNNAGRPIVPRRHAPLLTAIERLACDQLILEFANREMAEVEILERLATRFEIAAGVIDVKSFHVETPEETAARIKTVLRFVPVEKLSVTADCGFSALPRYIARDKLRAMVAGAKLVRATLE